MSNTVFCPVINRQIDGATCLVIVLVADREAKPSILPSGLSGMMNNAKSAWRVNTTLIQRRRKFSPHLLGCSELKIILSGYDELANATETLIHWNYNKILKMR